MNPEIRLKNQKKRILSASNHFASIKFFAEIRTLVAMAASDLKSGKNEELNGRNRYEEEGKGKRTREARENVNQTVHLRYLVPLATARINK